MHVDGLHGRCRRRVRVTTVSYPTARPATNQLAQQFRVAAPNRVWAADMTAIPTLEGWLYLTVVLDLFIRIAARNTRATAIRRGSTALASAAA